MSWNYKEDQRKVNFTLSTGSFIEVKEVSSTNWRESQLERTHTFNKWIKHIKNKKKEFQMKKNK